MRRAILLITLVVVIIVLAGSSASVVPDNDTLSTHRDISGNKVTTNQTAASNPSASTTITITMYTGDAE